MARPIYQHELKDPDFTWLISNFQENNPEYSCVQNSCLPIVFIREVEPAEEPFTLAPVIGEEVSEEAVAKGK